MRSVISAFAYVITGFVAGAVFFIAASIILAWTGPTSAPPNGNVSAPINVGAVDQIKNAGLGVNALAVFGNAILSGMSRYLNFGTTAGASGYGIRDNAGSIEFKNNGGNWQGIASSSSSGGSAKIFVGLTSSAYTGSQVAGYAGGNAKCVAAFGTGARMCATSDFPNAIPNPVSEAWYNGFDTVPFYRQDCEAWTSNSNSSYGHTWSAAGTPDAESCGNSYPVTCCK